MLSSISDRGKTGASRLPEHPTDSTVGHCQSGQKALGLLEPETAGVKPEVFFFFYSVVTVKSKLEADPFRRKRELGISFETPLCVTRPTTFFP